MLSPRPRLVEECPGRSTVEGPLGVGGGASVSPGGPRSRVGRSNVVEAAVQVALFGRKEVKETGIESEREVVRGGR